MKTFKELKRNLKKSDTVNHPIKVSLLGDTATQLLATAICGEGIDRSYRIDLFEADYNQVERQVMDPTSQLYTHDAEYTVVFQSTHKLLEHYSLMPASEWHKLAADRIDFIRSICESINGKIIYYNYPEIDDTVFGSYANKVPDSFTYQLRKLNYELMNLAHEYPNLFICDIAAIQNKFGRDFMFDPTVYVSTEMVLSINALPYVASRTLDIISSIEGKFKKCLILDLDNTLWGGIVGDDGWENIQIGHGLGIGKAFSEFQQWIKKLKNRGIIVCICSKNDEDKAKEPFEKNPEMVLKLEDISVFTANWDNKADNIRTIQSILNIGFDSMVFLDDNPFEREMVREHIPGITVPELPEDPGKYLEYLYGLNLFETASYSSADKDRTRQYQIEAERVSTAKKFTNESDFLKSLNMVSQVAGFNRYNTPRVAQLSQRSNQFNLRTIRYTEDQIENIENDPRQKGFSFTLEDRFGDNGLISVVVLQDISEKAPSSLLPDPSTLFIDTWFMSCRVLKRGMENFILNTIVAWAKEHGYKKIIGEYIPTPKNGMVAGLYADLGFTKREESAVAQWELDVNSYSDRECYILIEQHEVQ